MKFSNILFAVFGLSTFVAALPAPVPVADANLDLLEKRDLVAREPLGALEERTSSCSNLEVDVQACIDAVVAINKKYTSAGSYTKSSCQSWAAEVIVEVKALITVISSYPSGCSFPPINVCVDIFVKLLVCIFVQLKLFIDISGGLLGIILLTVDLLLSILLGYCGDLLKIVVSLLVLIEAKIKVGICALIIKGCGGLIVDIYIQVLVKLCLQVGLVL
jgi:hypothetical protein